MDHNSGEEHLQVVVVQMLAVLRKVQHFEKGYSQVSASQVLVELFGLVEYNS